eukprot:3467978-Rhodomonas_salina.2
MMYADRPSVREHVDRGSGVPDAHDAPAHHGPHPVLHPGPGFGVAFQWQRHVHSSSQMSADSAEMDHAAPAWAFQTFLWLYILFSYFLLVNIFLAILVDAYLAAKDGLPDSAPITEEVCFQLTPNRTRSLFQGYLRLKAEPTLAVSFGSDRPV